MCFPKTPKAPQAPAPAPAPAEVADLSITADTKKKSKRTSAQTSGSAPYRQDLSLNSGSAGSGLSIHK